MATQIAEYIDFLRMADRQLFEIVNTRKTLEPNFHANLDCTFVFDENCRYLYVSIFGAHTLGLNPADMEGKHWREIGLSPEVMEPFEEQIKYVLHTGKPTKLDAYIEPTGEYVECNLHALYEECGKRAAIICTVCNVSERKKTEMEIAKLDRLNLIGEMAAGVAHEVRNPMTVIKGYLQYFKQRPQQMVEKIDLVLDELERIEFIISDFLSMAQIKNAEKAVHNLNEIIQRIYPLICADAIREGVTVEVQLCKNIPALLLNPKEMKQLILNLARNGIEAMAGARGTLRIETKYKSDEMILEIADNGPGISKHLQHKIFDPFYTTKDNGTGLGLSVCASIVERHGGRITLKSREGKGTKFMIMLPVHQKYNSLVGSCAPWNTQTP